MKRQIVLGCSPVLLSLLFASLVSAQGLGVAVPESDPDALADALELMLFDEQASARARTNVGRVRQEFTWDKALAPLIEFCRDPRPAPDRLPPEEPGRRQAGQTRVLRARIGGDIRTAQRYLAEGGVRSMLDAVTARLRRNRDARQRQAAKG